MASIPPPPWELPVGLESSTPTPEPAQGPRIIVALDFGNCSTSVAYLVITSKLSTISGKIGAIRILRVWPTGLHDCVPSKISYTPSPKGCRQWGYDIDDNSRIHEWIRVGLEDKPRDVELVSFVTLIHEARRSDLADSVLPELYKSPEQMARDYLRHVAEQVLEELDQLVYNVNREITEIAPIDLVVSYPSLWSEANKRRYFQVLKLVFDPVFPKLRHLYFVGETYATAYWGILTLWERDDFRRELREDTSILVCNTEREPPIVIAATYKVVDIDDRNKLSFQLQRVGYESKTIAGWSRVDKAFESHLRHCLGPKDAYRLFVHDDNSSAIVKSKVWMPLRYWELFRDSFDGKERELGFMKLPPGIGDHDKPEMGILCGTIEISVNEMKGFYDPSVDSIIGLLSRQIELADHAGAPVKIIALSGSFGRQPYVAHRIREFGRSRRIDVIDVAGGDDDSLSDATAHGSISCVVNSGKEIPVHVLTMHYGICHSPKFDWAKHKPEDLRISPENAGNHRAKGQIKWLFTKGEAIFPDAENTRRESLDIIQRFRQEDFVPGKVSRIVFVTCTCSVDSRPNRMLDLETQNDACNIINLDFELSLVPWTERRGVEQQDPKPKGRLFGKAPQKSLYVEIRLSAEVKTDVSGVHFSVSCGSKILVEKNTPH